MGLKLSDDSDTENSTTQEGTEVPTDGSESPENTTKSQDDSGSF